MMSISPPFHRHGGYDFVSPEECPYCQVERLKEKCASLDDIRAENQLMKAELNYTNKLIRELLDAHRK